MHMHIFRVKVRWPSQPLEVWWVEVEASNAKNARMAAVAAATEEYPERQDPQTLDVNRRGWIKPL